MPALSLFLFDYPRNLVYRFLEYLQYSPKIMSLTNINNKDTKNIGLLSLIVGQRVYTIISTDSDYR